MLQVLVAGPVHLPAQVVPGVHHLVGQCVLEMAPVTDLVGADEDAVAGAEAAALAVDLAVLGEAGGAATADDVVAVEAAVEGLDLFAQEPHRGRVLHGEVPVVLAPLAVTLLVGRRPRLPVMELALGRHLAGQDLEIIDPPFGLRVEARPRRVVLDDRGQVGRGGGGSRRSGTAVWRGGFGHSARRLCWRHCL